MKNLVFAASLAAIALVAFLAVPAVSLGSADGGAIGDDHAASLYGGACGWKSTTPRALQYCGPQGTCGFVYATYDTGTTDDPYVGVLCGNNANCNAYITQLKPCGSK
ncbi:MAG TPA: hypothetical protein VFE78_05930 [Gemmataceae bacterium]|jgi:hypothetical protein|nr:hypothetical protein [Gemmataceae bacterium]